MPCGWHREPSLQQREGHMLWTSPAWWVLSHDTLIWHLPLDSKLGKQGLASRSEFANLGSPHLPVGSVMVSPLQQR
jgi:hypothetical protein